MIRISPVVLAALLGCAVPAHAADLATIGCVDGKLDSAVRDQVAADVEKNLADTGQRGSYSPPVVEALKNAAAACAKDNGWAPAAERPAVLYTLAKLSLPVVQKAVADKGLDPAALEALWFALPEEQRNKPLETQTYRDLADAAVPEGDMRTQAMGALVHTFFEFESILQYASVDFAQA